MGGRTPVTGTDDYLKRVVKFRGKLISEMEPILDHVFCEPRCEKCKEKFQLILKMGPLSMPKELAIGGLNGETIKIEVAAEIIKKNDLGAITIGDVSPSDTGHSS